MRLLISVLTILIFTLNYSFAEVRYADNLLTSDCNGDYSISGRSCSGTDGNAYVKIQTAINSMSLGDKIYVREGTYHEENGNENEMINIPDSLNGSSWDEGDYNYLGSYPGEWAIIDGEFDAPKGVVLGNKYMSTGGTHYWEFERLGFTRGTTPSDNDNGGSALWIAEGPVKVRYCNFYNNWDDSELNNPAGLTLYRLENSTIEYNRFYQNGCSGGSNCTNIDIYSDYDWNDWIDNWDNFDISNASRKNVFRYNYFEDSAYGLKDKGIQMLSQIEGIDLTWQEYGDKIHHNICVNQDRAGIMINQDFKQVYNNILDNSQINDGEGNSSYRVNLTVYNNTIIEGVYRAFGNNDWAYVPKEHLYNNIITKAPSSSEVKPIITGRYVENPDGASGDRFVVDHCYFYDITSTNVILDLASVLSGSHSFCGEFTVPEFDTEYGYSNNYKDSSEGTDNLFEGDSGASKYITRPEHVVGGATTIGSGGVGGSHPYLSEITLPSYIGATNPDDHAWVAGVLDMDSIYFTNQLEGSDPDWIEGGGSPPLPPSEGSPIGGNGDLRFGGNSSARVK